MSVELGTREILLLIVGLILVIGILVLMYWISDQRRWSKRHRISAELSALLETIENNLSETDTRCQDIQNVLPLGNPLERAQVAKALEKVLKELHELASSKLLEPCQLVRLVGFENEALAVELAIAKSLGKNSAFLNKWSLQLASQLMSEPASSP